MSQLNLILYILGSDWYFRRKLQWLMLKLHMYEKKVFSLKEGAVKNGDINWRGMGLLSYPILSTLSSNLILSYLTLKCSRWQDDWNWREVAATAGLHHFSKGARGKFKESGSRSSPKNCKLLKSGLAGYGIIRIILLYLINLILSIRLNLRCQRQVQGKLDPDPDQPKICKLLKN